MNQFDADTMHRALEAFGRSRVGGGAVQRSIVDVQAEAVAEILDKLERQRSVLLYASTGSGKTVQALLVALVRSTVTGKPAVLLAPKQEVIDERWMEDLRILQEAMNGCGPLLESLGDVRCDELPLDGQRLPRAGGPALYTTTVAKLRAGGASDLPKVAAQRRRLVEKVDPCLVVLDEAHRGTGEHTMAGQVLRTALQDVPLLAMTATPIRRSDADLEAIVDINGTATEIGDVSSYQRTVHDLVRTWWSLDDPGPEHAVIRVRRSAATAARPAAERAFRQYVVHPAGCRPSLDEDRVRVDVPLPRDGAWEKGYGLARVLPALLSRESSESDDLSTARPSDVYRRMLLSSNEAFWVSNTAQLLGKANERLSKPYQQMLRQALGPRETRRKSGHLHPKVAWTVAEAARRARTAQVLVFVGFRATADAIAASLEGQRGVSVGRAGDPSDVDEFRSGARGMVLIATPKSQESIELDKIHAGKEEPRVLIVHDLPWSAVSLQQMMGRLSRARWGFPGIELRVPVLALPDDQRIWATVKARWEVADMIDVGGGFEQSASPKVLPPELRNELRLGEEPVLPTDSIVATSVEASR